MKKQLHIFGIFTLLFLYSYAFAWQSQAKIVERVTSAAPLSFVEKVLDMHAHVQAELPSWQNTFQDSENESLQTKLFPSDCKSYLFGIEFVFILPKSEKLAVQNPSQAAQEIQHFFNFHDFV